MVIPELARIMIPSINPHREPIPQVKIVTKICATPIPV